MLTPAVRQRLLPQIACFDVSLRSLPSKWLFRFRCVQSYLAGLYAVVWTLLLGCHWRRWFVHHLGRHYDNNGSPDTNCFLQGQEMARGMRGERRARITITLTSTLKVPLTLLLENVTSKTRCLYIYIILGLFLEKLPTELCSFKYSNQSP